MDGYIDLDDAAKPTVDSVGSFLQTLASSRTQSRSRLWQVLGGLIATGREVREHFAVAVVQEGDHIVSDDVGSTGAALLVKRLRVACREQILASLTSAEPMATFERRSTALQKLKAHVERIVTGESQNIPQAGLDAIATGLALADFASISVWLLLKTLTLLPPTPELTSLLLDSGLLDVLHGEVQGASVGGEATSSSGASAAAIVSTAPQPLASAVRSYVEAQRVKVADRLHAAATLGRDAPFARRIFDSAPGGSVAGGRGKARGGLSGTRGGSRGGRGGGCGGKVVSTTAGIERTATAAKPSVPRRAPYVNPAVQVLAREVIARLQEGVDDSRKHGIDADMRRLAPRFLLQAYHQENILPAELWRYYQGERVPMEAPAAVVSVEPIDSDEDGGRPEPSVASSSTSSAPAIAAANSSSFPKQPTTIVGDEGGGGDIVGSESSSCGQHRSAVTAASASSPLDATALLRVSAASQETTFVIGDSDDDENDQKGALPPQNTLFDSQGREVGTRQSSLTSTFGDFSAAVAHGSGGTALGAAAPPSTSEDGDVDMLAGSSAVVPPVAFVSSSAVAAGGEGGANLQARDAPAASSASAAALGPDITTGSPGALGWYAGRLQTLSSWLQPPPNAAPGRGKGAVSISSLVTPLLRYPDELPQALRDWAPPIAVLPGLTPDQHAYARRFASYLRRVRDSTPDQAHAAAASAVSASTREAGESAAAASDALLAPAGRPFAFVDEDEGHNLTASHGPAAPPTAAVGSGDFSNEDAARRWLRRNLDDPWSPLALFAGVFAGVGPHGPIGIALSTQHAGHALSGAAGVTAAAVGAPFPGADLEVIEGLSWEQLVASATAHSSVGASHAPGDDSLSWGQMLGAVTASSSAGAVEMPGDDGVTWEQMLGAATASSSAGGMQVEEDGGQSSAAASSSSSLPSSSSVAGAQPPAAAAAVPTGLFGPSHYSAAVLAAVERSGSTPAAPARVSKAAAGKKRSAAASTTSDAPAEGAAPAAAAPAPAASSAAPFATPQEKSLARLLAKLKTDMKHDGGKKAEPAAGSAQGGAAKAAAPASPGAAVATAPRSAEKPKAKPSASEKGSPVRPAALDTCSPAKLALPLEPRDCCRSVVSGGGASDSGSARSSAAAAPVALAPAAKPLSSHALLKAATAGTAAAPPAVPRFRATSASAASPPSSPAASAATGSDGGGGSSALPGPPAGKKLKAASGAAAPAPAAAATAKAPSAPALVPRKGKTGAAVAKAPAVIESSDEEEDGGDGGGTAGEGQDSDEESTAARERRREERRARKLAKKAKKEKKEKTRCLKEERDAHKASKAAAAGESASSAASPMAASRDGFPDDDDRESIRSSASTASASSRQSGLSLYAAPAPAPSRGGAMADTDDGLVLRPGGLVALDARTGALSNLAADFGDLQDSAMRNLPLALPTDPAESVAARDRLFRLRDEFSRQEGDLRRVQADVGIVGYLPGDPAADPLLEQLHLGYQEYHRNVARRQAHRRSASSSDANDHAFSGAQDGDMESTDHARAFAWRHRLAENNYRREMARQTAAAEWRKLGVVGPRCAKAALAAPSAAASSAAEGSSSSSYSGSAAALAPAPAPASRRVRFAEPSHVQPFRRDAPVRPASADLVPHLEGLGPEDGRPEDIDKTDDFLRNASARLGEHRAELDRVWRRHEVDPATGQPALDPATRQPRPFHAYPNDWAELDAEDRPENAAGHLDAVYVQKRLAHLSSSRPELAGYPWMFATDKTKAGPDCGGAHVRGGGEYFEPESVRRDARESEELARHSAGGIARWDWYAQVVELTSRLAYARRATEWMLGRLASSSSAAAASPPPVFTPAAPWQRVPDEPARPGAAPSQPQFMPAALARIPRDTEIYGSAATNERFLPVVPPGVTRAAAAVPEALRPAARRSGERIDTLRKAARATADRRAAARARREAVAGHRTRPSGGAAARSSDDEEPGTSAADYAPLPTLEEAVKAVQAADAAESRSRRAPDLEPTHPLDAVRPRYSVRTFFDEDDVPEPSTAPDAVRWEEGLHEMVRGAAAAKAQARARGRGAGALAAASREPRPTGGIDKDFKRAAEDRNARLAAETARLRAVQRIGASNTGGFQQPPVAQQFQQGPSPLPGHPSPSHPSPALGSTLTASGSSTSPYVSPYVGAPHVVAATPSVQASTGTPSPYGETPGDSAGGIIAALAALQQQQQQHQRQAPVLGLVIPQPRRISPLPNPTYPIGAAHAPVDYDPAAYRHTGGDGIDMDMEVGDSGAGKPQQPPRPYDPAAPDTTGWIPVPHQAVPAIAAAYDPFAALPVAAPPPATVGFQPPLPESPPPPEEVASVTSRFPVLPLRTHAARLARYDLQLMPSATPHDDGVRTWAELQNARTAPAMACAPGGERSRLDVEVYASSACQPSPVWRADAEGGAAAAAVHRNVDFEEAGTYHDKDCPFRDLNDVERNRPLDSHPSVHHPSRLRNLGALIRGVAPGAGGRTVTGWPEGFEQSNTGRVPDAPSAIPIPDISTVLKARRQPYPHTTRRPVPEPVAKPQPAPLPPPEAPRRQAPPPPPPPPPPQARGPRGASRSRSRSPDRGRDRVGPLGGRGVHHDRPGHQFDRNGPGGGRRRSPSPPRRGRSPSPQRRGRPSRSPRRGRSPSPPGRRRSPSPRRRRSQSPPGRGHSAAPPGRGRSPPRPLSREVDRGRDRPGDVQRPPGIGGPVLGRPEYARDDVRSNAALAQLRNGAGVTRVTCRFFSPLAVPGSVKGKGCDRGEFCHFLHNAPRR